MKTNEKLCYPISITAGGGGLMVKTLAAVILLLTLSSCSAKDWGYKPPNWGAVK
ncbi:MAG: hypothetical protein ACK502_07950 [Alphaproteobacteria bacterium]|jgi:hypothetical protein